VHAHYSLAPKLTAHFYRLQTEQKFVQTKVERKQSIDVDILKQNKTKKP